MEYFVPSETSVSPLNALLLSIADLPKYLDKALNALSLHTEARTSFITYWLPSFLKHTHIAIRFLPQVSYERAAPLEVTPSPDVVTRIFMLFRGVDDDALSQWTDRWARQDDAELGMWRDCVGVDLDKALNEKLFRVLEWGGMEVDA
ncbi:hypothetical protein QCA50_002842 [Cerrena zonata]|uniref:Uncharacterized protein n=1 Tax=Cerrena zonata TaxID=2478898 RepID=A0AAW0GQI0_9APHY